MTVLQDRDPEEIILSFTPLQAKYFESKPFHQYEVVEKNQQYLIIKMRLIINYELIRKLAGFGTGVKVLRPITLKKELIQYLQAAIEQYKH